MLNDNLKKTANINKIINYKKTYGNTFNYKLDLIKNISNINIVLTLFICIFIIIPISSTNLKSLNKQKFVLNNINENNENYENNQINNFAELHNLISEKVYDPNNSNRLENFSSSATSLTISAGELSEAKLLLGCQNDFFNFSLRGRYQDFVLFNKARPVLIISSKNDMMIFLNYVVANKGLEYNGNFKIRSVLQWKLVYEEELNKTPIGWSKNVVTECGGVKMLGGYCQFGSGEVVKNFENLPVHSQLRIEANYHFIDAWHGEVGFMRINNGKDNEMQYAWIESYSAFGGDRGINVCGGKWPEGKFSVPINITIPHKANTIKIGFGATTEQDACDQSFGISGIRIYVK